MPTFERIGKSKVINHQEVPFRVLECKYSFDENGQYDEDNGSENMIIWGGNLETLKVLLPRCEGNVKYIYINPPYNIVKSSKKNKAWVYSDNIDDSRIKRWLNETVEDEGKDLTRYDKWLETERIVCKPYFLLRFSIPQLPIPTYTPVRYMWQRVVT